MELTSRLIDALVQKIPEQSSEQPLGVVVKRSRNPEHFVICTRMLHCFFSFAGRFQAFFLELQLVVPSHRVMSRRGVVVCTGAICLGLTGLLLSGFGRAWRHPSTFFAQFQFRSSVFHSV